MSYKHIKRLLDIMLVFVTAPLWLPILGACIALSRICDAGNPVFFAQMRTGLGGRRFAILKLRTMIPDAPSLKSDIAHLNIRTGPDFKARNDPRVTPLGRWFRRYYLDELPQLINVLRGDMSIVGPRPTSVPPHLYALWQTERFEVKPGLTCLWQLSQDQHTSFDERMRLDILYTRRCCVSLDLRILLRTAVHVIAGPGC